MASTECTSCGANVKEENAFCTSCGSMNESCRAPVLAPAPQTAVINSTSARENSSSEEAAGGFRANTDTESITTLSGSSDGRRKAMLAVSGVIIVGLFAGAGILVASMSGGDQIADISTNSQAADTAQTDVNPQSGSGTGSGSGPNSVPQARVVTGNPNPVTGTWFGDWNRVATGETTGFTMSLSEDAKGAITGTLTVSNGGPNAMKYVVSGQRTGNMIVLDGTSWINRNDGDFLDHMVFTLSSASQMDGNYANVATPNSVRGTVNAFRS